MISVHLQTGFALYLTVMLVFAAVLALQEWWHERNHGWHVAEENLCRCPDCHYTFVVRRNARSARCARCHNLCLVSRKLR